MHQEKVNHGTFIHNQHITFQRVGFVALVSFRWFYLQQTMDRFCLHAGSLRKALRRPACRGCKQDSRSGFPKSRNDTARSGGFPCSRSSRQNQNFAFNRRQDSLFLGFIVNHACFFPDTILKPFPFDRNLLRCGEDFPQAPGSTDLRKEEWRKVDGILSRFRNCFCFHILCKDHFIQDR